MGFREVGWWGVGFVDVDFEVGDVGREVFFEEEVGGAAAHAGADNCD